MLVDGGLAAALLAVVVALAAALDARPAPVAAVAPGVGLSALGGGLATYLLVLAVVAVARGRP